MENFQTSTDAQRVAYLKTTQWYSLCLELFDLQHPILSELGLLPILDGAMLPAMTSMTDSWRPSGSKSIYNYLANGSNQINDVDILFGYNSAEGWLFGQEAAIGDLDWYIDNNIDNRSSIKSPVVGSASSEFQLYMAEHYPSLSYTWQLQQLISSSVFGTSVANKIPNAIAKRNPNSKIYGYNFNWWGDVDNPQNGPFASLGIPSVHASELPYAFNCIDSLWIDQDTPQKELDEATKMHTMWGNFIKNGNPNLAGKSDWQPYANTDAQPYSGQIMNFGPTGDTYGLPIDIDGGAREYITKFVDYWMFGIGNDPSDI
jgi:carboxylesterase type B